MYLFLSFLFGVNVGKFVLNNEVQRQVSNRPIIRFVREKDYKGNEYSSKEYRQRAFHPSNFALVPTEEDAARLAYEYVSAIYGETCAIEEQPYTIRLNNDSIWTVGGYLPQNKEGGTFSMCIDRYSGCVGIMHPK